MTDRAAGSATVLVLAAVLLLGVTTAVGMLVAAGTVARHRAAAAADLAALAAAAHPFEPPGPVCAVAVRVARANGTRLTRCTVAGAAVEVVVQRAAPAWVGWLGPAVGRARAEAFPDIAEQPGSTDWPS
jgi:secretion/DNA translocation related TadE-like protein